MDKTGLGEILFREFSAIIPGVSPFHFTHDEKYKLLMDLRHEFETFNYTIPYSKDDLQTYNYTQELLKELNDFQIKINERTKKTTFQGGKYDDCVISLALANKASQNFNGQVSIASI